VTAEGRTMSQQSLFETVEFKSDERHLLAAPYVYPDLTTYQHIVINSSAGKDSQAMLSALVRECIRQGVDPSRITVVHCDLGRVEWEGTRELAEKQAEAYGLRFEVVSRDGDLLDQIEDRGMFPDSKNRYCTSDQKTSQVHKLFTRLTKESKAAGHTGQIRILSCLGIRAQESVARAQKAPIEKEKKPSNATKHVDRWLPIFRWTEDQVWAEIRESTIAELAHPAYSLGMSRLSCVFCVFASKSDLAIAAEHNPELLASYARTEDLIGHRYTATRSLVELANSQGIEWTRATIEEREQWNARFRSKVSQAAQKLASLEQGTKKHEKATRRLAALKSQLAGGEARLVAAISEAGKLPARSDAPRLGRATDHLRRRCDRCLNHEQKGDQDGQGNCETDHNPAGLDGPIGECDGLDLPVHGDRGGGTCWP
jgi:3'-phosphoadenosine 5'-phosphosulfate sulfotransferase (PAPS reductase)/FAD synthetase